SPTVEGEPDPDRALVDAVVSQVSGVLALVKSARRHRELRTTLAPLVALHTAHLEVLGADPAGASGRPGSPASAYRQVRTQEQALQQHLAGSAVDASSGALARLFASMSARVA